MVWGKKKAALDMQFAAEAENLRSEADKKRRHQEQLQAAAAAAAWKQQQESGWVKSVSKNDLHDLFSNLREDLETGAAQQLSPKNQKAQIAAVSLFDQTRNLWGMIDRNLVSDEQASVMFEIIHQLIPQHVQDYLSRAAPDSAHDALTLNDDIPVGKEKQRVQMSYGSFYFQDKVTYKYMVAFSQSMGEVTASLLKIKNSIFHQTVYPEARPTPTASAFSMLPLPLNEEAAWPLIHQIEALWSEANTRRNSMEDNYFLEQTSTVYVPDAVKMYSTFKLASPEIQKRARHILVEQLSIVEGRLRLILDKTMEVNLGDMEAQLEFLRYKTEGDATYDSVKSRVLTAVQSGGSI